MDTQQQAAQVKQRPRWITGSGVGVTALAFWLSMTDVGGFAVMLGIAGALLLTAGVANRT